MLTERRVKKDHVANMVALFIFVCKQLRSFLLEYQRFFHTVNVACSDTGMCKQHSQFLRPLLASFISLRLQHFCVHIVPNLSSSGPTLHKLINVHMSYHTDRSVIDRSIFNLGIRLGSVVRFTPQPY